MSKNDSAGSHASIGTQGDECTSEKHVRGPARRDNITAEVAASSSHTRRAYTSDWQHFGRWCRRQGHLALLADPFVVSLYIEFCAGDEGNSLATIQRRLSSLIWNLRQRGHHLDRQDQRIVAIMNDLRLRHNRPASKTHMIGTREILAMLATLDQGSLRGIRDRAMLLVGFVGGLKRSELVGLDVKHDQSEDRIGSVEVLNEGMVITFQTKRGWREIEIGRGSSQLTCPVAAVENWMRFARITHGPLFRRVRGRGRDVGKDRLNDKEVARLIKRTASAAGIGVGLGSTDSGLRFHTQTLRTARVISPWKGEAPNRRSTPGSDEDTTPQDRFLFNLTRELGL